MTITENRKRVLDLSELCFLSVPMVLARRESFMHGIRDLQGKKVAMIEGSLRE